jgi:hypothetical protein
VKPTAVLAAAAVLLIGCGGKQSAAQSPADVAPLDTYALIRGEPAKVRDALGLLPDGPRLGDLLARARAAAGGDGSAYAVLDPDGRRVVAITKGDAPAGLPHAGVRGWTVFSRSRAPVDAVRRAKHRLAEATWYRPVTGDATFQLPRLTVTARRDGDRETAEQGVLASHDVEHPLAELIPHDAVAAAAFDRAPTLPFGDALERGLGVRIVDLQALTPRGGVAFLRPAEPVPTVTVLAPGGTMAAARRVVTELDPGAPPAVAATLDGAPVRLVHFGALDLYYGRFGDTLVLTDDPDLRLHDVEALAPSGLPPETQDWYYLETEQGLPALRSLATLAGTRLSPSFEAKVISLGSVLAYHAGGKLVVSVT